MPTARQIREEDVREPGTYVSVAVIRVTRAELEDRQIALQTPVEDGSWDEAGPIQEALIATPTGEQPLLIWHLVFEEVPEETGNRPSLELRAPIATAGPDAFVAATLDALDLPRTRAEWIVS